MDRARARDGSQATRLNESGLLGLDGERLRPLGAIVNADELNERLLTGIAEAPGDDADDPQVAAVAIREARGDGAEQERHGFLVPEGGKGTSPKVVRFQLRPDPLAR